MNKCKDPKMSMRMGGVLREMVGELNGERPSLIIPYRFLPISPEKIAEGKKIIERLKQRSHFHVLDAPIQQMRDALSKAGAVNYVSAPESIYPLERNPKTGQMMKAKRSQ